MSDFKPGDLVIGDDFIFLPGGPYYARVHSYDGFICNFQLINPDTKEIIRDKIYSAPGYCFKHMQKPLRNVLKSKARQAAVRNSFEERTGQNAGPGSWADLVGAYSGNSVPKGAEAAWSDGRTGNWMRNPLSSREGRRGWKYVPHDGGTRKRKAKGRKTLRGRRR